MEIKKVHFKSDFKVILASETGWTVPFRLKFYTNAPSRPFVATFDGTTYNNCHLENDGRLCVAFDNHKLGLGSLMLEPTFYIDDACYQDGICDEVIPAFKVTVKDTSNVEYEIKLTLDGVKTLETVGTLPAFYMKGPKGDTGATGATGPTGPAGPAGSDAEVTKANIVAALGYTPADNEDVEDFQTELAECIVKGDEAGSVITEQPEDWATKSYVDSKISGGGSGETYLQEENGVDFSIADEDGNVIAAFAHGNIRTKRFNSGGRVHFSFDDGEYSIIDLFTGNYTSVWSSPFFAALKELHEDYDAKFTINLFTNTFSYITNAFATELGEASDWLKWTLHGDKTTNYATRTAGASDWDNMVAAVVLLTGTPNAIDRHTRLSNFAGTETQITAMRDCKFGAVCFSAADTSGRSSYDFDTNEVAYCWGNEKYYNSKTRLTFVRSYARFDSLTLNDSALASIKAYIEDKDFAEFFIHEYSVFDSNKTIVSSGLSKLTTFFSFLKDNNFETAFYKY